MKAFRAISALACAVFMLAPAVAQAQQLPDQAYGPDGVRRQTTAAAIVTYDSVTGDPCVVGSTASCTLGTAGSSGGGGGGTLSAVANASAQTALDGATVSLSTDLFRQERVLIGDAGGAPISFNDTRAVDVGLSSTVSSAISAVGLDGGVATVTGYISGFAGGDSVVFEETSDSTASTPHWTAVRLFQGGQPVSGGTLSADGKFTFKATGSTAWRARTSVGGSGSMKISYSITPAVDVVHAVVSGPTLAGATFPTYPEGIMCRAASAAPTEVADGQGAAIQCGLSGKLIVQPYSIKETMVRGFITSTDTAAHTILSAPAGSLKNYVTSAQCSNSSGTDVSVTFNDTASTQLFVPKGGGNNATFPVPLVAAAATAFTFTSGGSQTTVACAAQGYTGL